VTAASDPLEALRRRHAWPTRRPDVRAVDWSLDGGGRQLVTQLVTRLHAQLLLEVGAFLGGSLRTWLDHDPQLVVIAVDPWSGSWWGEYARKRGQPEIAAQLDAPDGPYETFLATNWDYRERIVPVRGVSPAALEDVAAAGARPDVIYLDSDKSGRELAAFARLFPDAVVCGDDWGWGVDRLGDPDAGYPIRAPVRRFVAERGLHLRTQRATWVADPEPPTLGDRIRQGLEDLRSSARRLRSALRWLSTRTARNASTPSANAE
jgi:hypothetical protein